MSTFNKTVLDVSYKSKGNSTWTVIKTKGKDGGKDKDDNIFDRELAKMFQEDKKAGKLPAIYTCHYEKSEPNNEGKSFWNLVGAERMGAADGPSEPAASSPAKTDTRETPAEKPTTSQTKQPAGSSAVAEITRMRHEISLKAIEATGRRSWPRSWRPKAARPRQARGSRSTTSPTAAPSWPGPS
jgi:hypothetical protein